MSYHFLAKARSRSSSSSHHSLSPPRTSRPSNRPPIHPPPPQPPQSAVTKASRPKPAANEQSFPPYPHSIPAGYVTPHPHVTVETVRTAHIPSLTRITGLLLPIRYPNSFYTATITDPVIASLSRVAIYHDHPVAAAPESGPTSMPLGSSAATGADKVIGGIRCRLEGIQPRETTQGQQPTNLYIQTLHLLSPYRGHGVATSLLNSLLFASPPDQEGGYQVSELVKHYNIRSVTAHVHEANEDGLKWYMARGFSVEEGVVEAYYRRLRPSGARIVRLNLQWTDSDERSPVKSQDQQTRSKLHVDGDDEDWEKVEAEDGEEGDHGVRPLSGSRVDMEELGSRKRKAEQESENQPSRK